MLVALDAMGGDYGPSETVKGAVEACQEWDLRVILVGPEALLHAELSKFRGFPAGRIEIVHAGDVIAMSDHPASAVKKKDKSSLVVANRLVKDGKASAVISAGNTGAAMAASLLTFGRIEGVARPAIAIPMPTLQGVSVLLDAGANSDCTPENLYQFAIMGSIYADKVLNIPNPRIGLLNIGEEKTKGNNLTLAAYDILSASKLNFIGNIEGMDVHHGKADVIVCDGFLGNVVLKLSEGLASALFKMIKSQLSSSLLGKIGGLLIKPSLKGLLLRMDYAEYGGAPLLGLKNISIISHGSSKARAIKNAIRVAAKAVGEKLIPTIDSAVTSMKNSGHI
ncbi:MAG: phosphate acyltransferase PlsX [Bacillota bacterium]